MIQIFRPIPAGSLKLLVFDLDGTLADTSEDLCNSVNATLIHFGRQPLPDKLVASFVGNGAPMLLRRSLAHSSSVPVGEVNDEVLPRFYSYFLDHYIRHELDHTKAYPGVRESLRALHDECDQPRALAVVTNKPVRPAQEILEGLGIASYFVHIYGGDSFPVKKPDPKALLLLMEETDARSEETVMIGDSKVDVQTARNAGVWSLGCAFGYGPQNLMDLPPDVVVNSAKSWATVLRAATGAGPN